MTKTKRRRRHAVIIPPETDNSFIYCNGEEDYYWDCAPSIGREEMYIDAEKGELYPGRVVILKPTQRWVRGTDLSLGDKRPKYWEIVK